jgi:hypothetical protein
MTKPQSVYFKIDRNLYLIKQDIEKKSAITARPASTNFCVILDVSGSMSNDLPKIKSQLKLKLPTLLKEGDTLSMIWFSGKNEFGVIFEGEHVATLKDLNKVNTAIDRWLRPVGMTGFKEPIEEVQKLITRIGKSNKNPFALYFMSDGHDNQSNRDEIIEAVNDLAPSLASATFVEYGYYADRRLLASMAEKAGGTLIFAEAFDKYEPVFEAALSKRPLGCKRVDVAVDAPIDGFAWTLADNELTTFDATDGTASVPEGTETIYYLSKEPNGAEGLMLSQQAGNYANGVADSGAYFGVPQAYAALSLFAVRMKPDIVLPILKALGDVRFITAFSTCFGKQRYSEFMDAAKTAAFDTKKRFVSGRNPELVPADDAFTVLDLLKLISNDQATHLLMDHPEFKYSRISRGRVDGNEDTLSDAEQYKVDEIQAKMAGEKSVKKLKAYQAEITAIIEARKIALKFVPDPTPNGYSVSNLTYNEDRPNISVLIKKTGTVDLSPRSKELPKGVPTIFPTNIWRNYSIVRDGLVNVDKLPAVISSKMFEDLTSNNVPMKLISDEGSSKAVVIDVKALPILNRRMVKSVSAKETIELAYALTKARAAQKVYNFYSNTKFSREGGQKLTGQYGADAAEWLSEQGITDGGFSPKNQVAAPVADRYTGKELAVKLKGLSTLKTVNDVKDKLAKGKALTGCDAMMGAVIVEVEAFLAKNPANVHEKWLEGKVEAAKAAVRGLIHQLAVQKFGVIVGQNWFSEFSSLDETTLVVDIDGLKIEGKFEMREIQIEI